MRTGLVLSTVFLGAMLTAQTGDSTAVQPSGPRPAPQFYSPPDVQQIIQEALAQVDGLDAGGLTVAFVRNLLDSLNRTLQEAIDSLEVRAQAFEYSPSGYRHRYYRSDLTRREILSDLISPAEARERPHFHAIYDPQGYLVRVAYIEPRLWRDKQAAVAMGRLQGGDLTPELVRYYRRWDHRRLKGLKYIKKKRLKEEQPYYRILYDEQDNVKEIQYYDSGEQLVYTMLYRRAEGGKLFADVVMGSDGAGSLTDLHADLYLADWSRVKSGWRVAITQNDEGWIASTQVFNDLSQLIYYYTFRTTFNADDKTRTIRGTVLSSDDEIRSVFATVYDKKNILIRRSFFTAEGALRETSRYEYDKKSGDTVIVTTNADGIELSRKILLSRGAK